MSKLNKLLERAVKAGVCKDKHDIKVIFPYDLSITNSGKDETAYVAATSQKFILSPTIRS